MAQKQNHFIADLRDIHFVLFEQFGLGELLQSPLYAAGFDEDGAKMVLSESTKFANEVMGPLNAVGDQVGCRVENGAVITPPGFKEAWQKIFEAGLRTTAISAEYGGSGAPLLLAAAVEEILCGANVAFNMYPGLAMGAAEVIEQFGTTEQKEMYLRRMYGGQWGGTMCLTEAHAGSDVGSARTKAIRQPDGSFLISGTKIFISGGDHDLAENIIHLVLARIEGSPAGTKGLSLFIVPKVRHDESGALGRSNDVSVAGIEHKMGINGSATCVMSFGENGACRGHIVGGAASENQGMRQMFLLMNAARIAVGLQSLGVASTAYLNALKYARERKQGPSVKHFKDPTAPRVPIIEHADIRRLLIDMKAHVEGMRALIFKLAGHRDRHEVAKHNGVGDANYHFGQIELLTPIVKAYCSEQAFKVCENAIQVLGGVGYTADYGIEQYCRDSKIFTIYEGTTHIQSMDLVARKLGQNNGENLKAFANDLDTFVAKHKEHPTLSGAVLLLGTAKDALQATTMKLLAWFYSGQLDMVPLFANRYLEMMAEVTISWLLLDQAIIGSEKRKALPEGHADHAFYEGKQYVAQYYAANILSRVEEKAHTFDRADRSALSISDAAFATI